jgi:YfiH family protein
MPQPVLTYYDVAPNVCAFSTTRHGGVSKGNYASLNIHLFQHDNFYDVHRNRQILLSELNVQSKDLFMPRQIHGDKVFNLDKSFLEKPKEQQEPLLDGIDALITNQVQICIGVSTADCVPVLLYDTKNKVSGAVHAGWRGTCLKIVGKTIDEMSHVYGTNPQDIKAVIGPCIRQDAYEVGEDVYDAFQEAHFEMESLTKKMNNRWHLDLAAANRDLLCQKGVHDASVFDCGQCTWTNDKDYFSARRLGIDSGRVYTGIIVRE